MLHFVRILLLPLCEIAIICMCMLRACVNDKDHPACFVGDKVLSALDPLNASNSNISKPFLSEGMITRILTYVSFFHTAVRLMADDSAKALFEVLARFKTFDGIQNVPMLWTKARLEPAGEKITQRGRKSYRLAWHNLYDTVQFFRSLFILTLPLLFLISGNNRETTNDQRRNFLLFTVGLAVILFGFAMKLVAVAFASLPVQRHAATLMTNAEKASKAIACNEKHRLLQTRTLTRVGFGDVEAWVTFDEEKKEPVLHVSNKSFVPWTPFEERTKPRPPHTVLRDLDFPDAPTQPGAQKPSEDIMTILGLHDLGIACGFILAPAFLWAIWTNQSTWWPVLQVLTVVVASGIYRTFVKIMASYVAALYLNSQYKKFKRHAGSEPENHIPPSLTTTYPSAVASEHSSKNQPVGNPYAGYQPQPSSPSQAQASMYEQQNMQQPIAPSRSASYLQPTTFQSTPPGSFFNSTSPAQPPAAVSYPPSTVSNSTGVQYVPQQPIPSPYQYPKPSPYHQYNVVLPPTTQQLPQPTSQNPYKGITNYLLTTLVQPSLEHQGYIPPHPTSPPTTSTFNPTPYPIPNAYTPPTKTPQDPLSSITGKTLTTALWIRWFCNILLGALLSASFSLLLPYTLPGELTNKNPSNTTQLNTTQLNSTATNTTTITNTTKPEIDSLGLKGNTDSLWLKIAVTIPCVVMVLAILPFYIRMKGPKALFYDVTFDHLTGVRCRLMIEEREEREGGGGGERKEGGAEGREHVPMQGVGNGNAYGYEKRLEDADGKGY
ncbi:hypothetical protein HDU97_001431 [Phlyctochytrium planicorne]|nr:hypothetical protein HDU97_001431 [Phlyctochytrium planicorne]